jgi:hypothetical protein
MDGGLDMEAHGQHELVVVPRHPLYELQHPCHAAATSHLSFPSTRLVGVPRDRLRAEIW